MKMYLAVYLAKENGDMLKKWEKLSPKERTALEMKGMKAWSAWAKKNKKSIVEIGSPLGGTLKTSKRGIHKTSNAMTAYTVVKAKNQKAAAKLFKAHPHFTIFPGDSVEVMECLPMPGSK